MDKRSAVAARLVSMMDDAEVDNLAAKLGVADDDPMSKTAAELLDDLSGKLDNLQRSVDALLSTSGRPAREPMPAPEWLQGFKVDKG